MAYFTIMNGLRGCYMPDSVNTVKCDTRRELKACLESEQREGYYGLSNKAVASAANEAWKARKSRSVYAVAILPYGTNKGSYPYAVEVCTATRSDYLENQGEF